MPVLILTLLVLLPSALADVPSRVTSANDDCRVSKTEMRAPFGCAVVLRTDVAFVGKCNDHVCPVDLNVTAWGTSRLPGQLDLLAYVLRPTGEEFDVSMCLAGWPVRDELAALQPDCPIGCAQTTIGYIVGCGLDRRTEIYVRPGGCGWFVAVGHVWWNDPAGHVATSTDYIVCQDAEGTPYIRWINGRPPAEAHYDLR